MRGTREPGVIVLGALALLFALSAAWFGLGLPAPACTFKQWAGIPCATCGTTRLVRALVAGRLFEALTWNPLVFCAILVTGSWGTLSTLRVAFGGPGSRSRRPEIRAWVVLLLAIAVIANWIYLLLLGV